MTEEELERKISQTYDTAAREMQAKTEAYFEKYQIKKEINRETMPKGKFNEWRKGQRQIYDNMKKMTAELSQEALKADELSRLLIQGQLPYAFAEGMNYGTFEVETLFGVDTSFMLYDKNEVLTLIKDEPQLLPQLKPESPTEKAIREGKILRWNQQKITQQITQGIIQGESIPKIAARLQTVTDMDKRAAIRNARTANTAARNAGHDAAYERANEMGIDIQRMWVSTLDDRTRIEHRDLDMQVRKVGEPFTTGEYSIMYPADPSAEPEMVYNCRCRIIGYNPKMNITLEDRNTKKLNEDYETWKHGHSTAQEQPEAVEQPATAGQTAEPAIRENPQVPPTSEWVDIMKAQSENSDSEFNEKMLSLEEQTLGKLTREQKNGIERYTGSSYDTMNDYLRGVRDTLPAHLEKDLNNAIEGLQSTEIGQQMVLRRGTDYGDIAGMFMTGDFNDNKQFLTELLNDGKVDTVNDMFEGAVSTLTGFTSTSSKWERGFTGSLEVLFFAPPETEGSSIMSISRFGTSEGETLLAPEVGVKFLGIEASEDGHKRSQYRMYVELIPKKFYNS